MDGWMDGGREGDGWREGARDGWSAERAEQMRQGNLLSQVPDHSRDWDPETGFGFSTSGCGGSRFGCSKWRVRGLGSPQKAEQKQQHSNRKPRTLPPFIAHSEG